MGIRRRLFSGWPSAVSAFALLAIAACSPRTDPALRPTPTTLTSADIRFFEANPLMVPVDGVSPRELRDSFNNARADGRTHLALDILAPRGTPVVAAISGEVLRLRQNEIGRAHV